MKSLCGNGEQIKVYFFEKLLMVRGELLFLCYWHSLNLIFEKKKFLVTFAAFDVSFYGWAGTVRALWDSQKTLYFPGPLDRWRRKTNDDKQKEVE